MTEILQNTSHISSSPSSFEPLPCASLSFNDGSHQTHLTNTHISNSPTFYFPSVVVQDISVRQEREEEETTDLSLLDFFATVVRKSVWIGCTSKREDKYCSSMEIGVPTNVRHVAHVTFDRFNGFLGLPVEFEPDVPRRPPSASASVFGVSTESMQLSFDPRGNSVPTILLLMQRRLYSQGGLEAEGIFRITADNSQEEFIRDQLNRGVIPDEVDVHCLAGLIKAWFRELPTGILDSLSTEQVMQSHSEEEYAQLVRLLPPTEAALLDWAINLMADVAQMEHLNKMNARNIAMVFAPNMTQMADPLTALMYAVQVMNFLKTLIIKTLREREDAIIEPARGSRLEPYDENEHHSSSQRMVRKIIVGDQEKQVFVAHEPAIESPPHTEDFATDCESQSCLTSIENIIPGGNTSLVDNCPCEIPAQISTSRNEVQEDSLTRQNAAVQPNTHKSKSGQPSGMNTKKGFRKVNERTIVREAVPFEKSRGVGSIRHISSRVERVEAWR
ncbi:CRIB domain [Dillenia turbinata]|uniref:CRIB domain n=1 Tax=Dillenia turbinata TaxID=194707 RepID=A0AAN8ZN81_9MAGN